MAESSKTLGLTLRGVSNKELGVPMLQSIFDQLPYIKYVRNDTAVVRDIATRLSNKLSTYRDVVAKIKSVVEILYFSTPSPLPNLPPCCSLSPPQLKYDQHFGVRVDRTKACRVAGVPNSIPIDTNFTSVLVNNLVVTPNIKWQYLISLAGEELEYPGCRQGARSGQECHSSSGGRHRHVFMSTLHPHVKRVVVLLDRGSLVSYDQLEQGKRVVNYVLETLSPVDQVAVVLVGARVETVVGDKKCDTGTMFAADRQAIQTIQAQLARVGVDTQPADHSQGFITAFQVNFGILNAC